MGQFIFVSSNKKNLPFKKGDLCPRLDSNQHAELPALPPQSSVSTNFTTWA